jgi:molecular chaperone GrpE
MNHAGTREKDEESIKVRSAENREQTESQADACTTGKNEIEDRPLEKMTKTELIQKVDELSEAVKKNYALYLRSQADMENLRKRIQKEKEDWIKFSNESLIRDLLPAVDAMEQAVSHCRISDENCLAALTEGVELTMKGLKDALEKAGLEAVKAQGEAFDPNYHHAVSEVEDKTQDPGVVLQELQKGYLLNQRLLRPVMVVVNKKSAACGEDNAE